MGKRGFFYRRAVYSRSNELPGMSEAGACGCTDGGWTGGPSGARGMGTPRWYTDPTEVGRCTSRC